MSAKLIRANKEMGETVMTKKKTKSDLIEITRQKGIQGMTD